MGLARAEQGRKVGSVTYKRSKEYKGLGQRKVVSGRDEGLGP